MRLRKITRKNIKSIARRRGFTLIEILIVIAVLGMLMTLLFVSLSDAGIDEKTAKLHFLASKSKLEFALFEFKNRYGRYPTSDEGLRALITPPPGIDSKDFPSRGFIEEKYTLDPWKRPYEFRSDGASYEVVSLGADGQPGGEGINKDINLKDIN
ncbi:MAG: type II secretion system major pseudopilin GspG [Leptospiraceae bacterium]|nr:type II secretion system major pseudopilin GspG [Leptospiraceae bacterium]MDW8306756.1 type II secretion system major pseudopilin GspG [Leptospiraceae bacterium]